MNTITKENEDAVKKVLNEVFDNFNFERVKKVMNILNWSWANLKGNDVPTLDEIKEKAANLMWDCATSDVDVISSGGFRVEKDFSDPSSLWMRLVFEVEECDYCLDEKF